MPITAEDYKGALDLVSSGALPAEYADKLAAKIKEYEQGVDSYGPPVAPPQSRTEEGKDLQGSPQSLGFAEDTPPSTAGSAFKPAYFYEPSLDEARKALSNQETANAVGATDLSPDLLSNLDSGSDAYRRYAESRWRAEQQKANASGQKLERFNTIQPTKHPLDYALGVMGKYLPSVAGGVDQAVTGGAIGNVSRSLEQAYPSQPDANDLQLQHEEPVAKGIGALGTYVLAPEAAPASAVGGRVAQYLGAKAEQMGLNAALKPLTHAAAGVAGAEAQTALDAGASAIPGNDRSKSHEQAAQQFMSEAPASAITGGIGGLAGGAVHELGKMYLGALRNANPGLSDLEAAGGRTDMLRGVSPPKAVKEFTDRAMNADEVAHPVDLAAEQVAPKIHADAQRAALENKQTIDKQIQDYVNSAEGKTPQSTMPALQGMLEYAKRGAFEKPFSGEVNNVNPRVVKTLGREIRNLGDVAEIDQGAVPFWVKSGKGMAVDQGTGLSEELLGRAPKPGKQVVVFPSPMNAQAVLQMEDRLYQELGYQGGGEPKDDQLLQTIASGFKQVRDKFQYFGPRGNQPQGVSVPGYERPGVKLSTPTSPESPETGRPTAPQESGAAYDPTIPAEAIPEYAKTELPKYGRGEAGENGKKYEHDIMAPGRQDRAAESARLAKLLEEPDLTPAERRMAEESAARAYEPGETAPNQGTYTQEEILDAIRKAGGVSGAGKLGMGMRDMTNALAPYAGKSAEEASQVAGNLKYPIELSVDGDNVMLRDGRHRLAAAQQSGAQEILARARKYRPDGKAEEVGVMRLPIGASSEQPKVTAREVPQGASASPPPQPPAALSLPPGSPEPKALPENAGPEGNPNIYGKYPQLEATLDDGTKVYGLSALRRQQHLATQALEAAAKKTGGNSLEGTTKKVINYKYGKGHANDDRELKATAARLGLSKELENVAATNAYQQLANRSYNQGALTSKLGTGLALRADPLVRYLSGLDNPFGAADRTPTGAIKRYMLEMELRNALNLSGGRAGVRADLVRKQIEDEKDK